MDYVGSARQERSGVDPLSGRLEALVAAMTTATAHASSDLVSVQVGADGTLKQLRIDDRAMNVSGAQLAAHIMDLVGRAHTELGERLRAEDHAVQADPLVAEAITRVMDAFEAPLPSRPAPRPLESDFDVHRRPASFLVDPLGRPRR
ncbi:MAG: hypothetical protein WAX14_07890 [Rhodococcus sp. (in: high G+C Gram-positive bacteria)]|uniref:YbaB/EbfC family nucleoid-associated protein n=1 Tax=Rhodococcus sp. TaxID=1831 RepID=UPI003BB78BF4